MKKALYLLINFLLISQLTTAQSVTLATSTINPTSGTVVYNNGTNQLQYWNGTAWIPITNAAAGTGWALAVPSLYTSNNVNNVGVGTSTPKAAFNVAAGKTVLFGADSSGVGKKLIWYASKGAFRVGSVDIFGPNNWDYLNVGYGSTALGYRTAASGGYSTALGFGTTASGSSSTALGELTTASGYGSTALGLGPTASGYGSTALGRATVAIGDYSTALGLLTTASGISSTALGSGTTASGTSSAALGNSTIASGDYSIAMGTYNIDVPAALLTIGNGTYIARANALTVMNDGKVGIGTSDPIAPLHISTAKSIFQNNINHYFSWATGSSISLLGTGTFNVGLLVDYDIVTKNSFVSAQTATTSDARIKNIIGLSNNQQDLDKVRQIQITDYRYKDVHTWGSQTFKKVIAQQVEEIYPQAVRKMTSTIPDIYSLAEKVAYNETNKKLTVSLSKNYEIRIDEKIEFIHEKYGKIQAIVESVLGNSFTVKDWKYETDKIFVYGREVNDFRTVDYEAISMLGISAIQQLAKDNEEMKIKNEELRVKNEQIEAKFKQMQADFSARIEAIEASLVKPLTIK